MAGLCTILGTCPSKLRRPWLTLVAANILVILTILICEAKLEHGCKSLTSVKLEDWLSFVD
jgi:hypothetical protein